MKLLFNGHHFKYELESLCRMFFPQLTLSGLSLEYDTLPAIAEDYVFTRRAKGRTKTTLYVCACIGGKGARHSLSTVNAANDCAADGYDAACERLLGVCMYRALQELTGIAPKWGILTGIRPVKRIHQYRQMGYADARIADEMARELLVTPGKIALAIKTADTETPLMALSGKHSYSLYVSIPFCPTRCSYCSFISHSVESARKLMPQYIAYLCRELEVTAKLAKALDLRLEAVYFGGGTPTTLEPSQLSALMDTVAAHFDLSQLREYTVEAGRPDTITPEKLAVLLQGGCTRISINPQTMNDSVLQAIGRNHTTQQTLDMYALARSMGFDNINMDLIAGLPTDTLESFCDTVERVIALSPENVTVHTLSLKRSSALYRANDAAIGNPTSEMVEYAARRLMESGYNPYYLYRQKNTVGNLENVGYAKPAKEGLYNVFIMEELHTILAVGAAGSTKLVDPKSGLIERVFNHKFPFEYIDRFDEVLRRKEAIREFYSIHHIV